MLLPYSQAVFLTMLNCPLLLTQQQADCLPGRLAIQEGLHAAVSGAMEASNMVKHTS